MNPQAKLESIIQVLMDFTDNFPYHPDHLTEVAQLRNISIENPDLVREIYSGRNILQGIY